MYYQDVQDRIKSQKYPNKEYPPEKKIDIAIVVDMLLTGFDSKYLNTLYVDKNLKHHRLIQACSRTNRVLNNMKPFGNIVDFRGQEKEVEEAIRLFSGKSISQSKEIWLVEPASAIIEKLKGAKGDLDTFMESQGLESAPEQVSNLKGDIARGEFIRHFKEIQRLKTQLDQYTGLNDDEHQTIEQLMPKDEQQAFKSRYLEIAHDLKEKQDRKGSDANDSVQQFDFEFVLFSSVVTDYDYIMSLIAQYTHSEPSKQEMTKTQLKQLIASDSKFMEEKAELNAYIDTLEIGKKQSLEGIKKGYEAFKAASYDGKLTAIAKDSGLEPDVLRAFIEKTIRRMIFDGEDLTDLMTPLELRWKDRTQRERALMKDLIPLLKKQAKGREISGLSAYDDIL